MKGQQAVELLIGVASVIGIFALFYWIFFLQYAGYVKHENELEGIAVADYLSREIGVASRAGDGYSKQLFFPAKLPGASDYSLLVNNVSGSVDIELVFSEANVFYYSSRMYTRDVGGGLEYGASNGFYVNKSASVFLENHGGYVFVNQDRVV